MRSYLELSRSLSEKIGASLLVIYERVLTTTQVEMLAKKIETLEYFHGMLNKQAEVSLSIPLADRVLSRYGEDAVGSMSFDKGFYKKENKELLRLYI